MDPKKAVKKIGKIELNRKTVKDLAVKTDVKGGATSCCCCQSCVVME